MSAQIEGSSTGICVDYDGSYFACDSGGGGGGGGFDPNMFAFEMGMGLLGQMLGGFMDCAPTQSERKTWIYERAGP